MKPRVLRAIAIMNLDEQMIYGCPEKAAYLCNLSLQQLIVRLLMIKTLPRDQTTTRESVPMRYR